MGLELRFGAEIGAEVWGSDWGVASGVIGETPTWRGRGFDGFS
jgi:hypothetical protein